MAINNRKFAHYFHADASAVGAAITKHVDEPFKQAFEAQATVSLPPVGGSITKNKPPFRFPADDKIPAIVSASVTQSEVHGVFQDGFPVTNSATLVEGLNVLDRVKAGKVVSQVTKEHPAPGDGDVPRVLFHEPKFRQEKEKVSFGDTQIKDLTIDGKSIEVILDLDFLEDKQDCPRKVHLRNEALWNKICKAYDDQAGAVHCTLVKEIKGVDGTHIKHLGKNGLQIEGFGNIYFAELIVQHHLYQLIMVRFELGCPTEGDVTVAVAAAEGSAGGGTGG